MLRISPQQGSKLPHQKLVMSLTRSRYQRCPPRSNVQNLRSSRRLFWGVKRLQSFAYRLCCKCLLSRGGPRDAVASSARNRTDGLVTKVVILRWSEGIGCEVSRHYQLCCMQTAAVHSHDLLLNSQRGSMTWDMHEKCRSLTIIAPLGLLYSYQSARGGKMLEVSRGCGAACCVDASLVGSHHRGCKSK